MAAEKARADKDYETKVASDAARCWESTTSEESTATDRLALQSALRDARSRAEAIDDPKVMAHQLQTALEVGDDVEAKASPLPRSTWRPIR